MICPKDEVVATFNQRMIQRIKNTTWLRVSDGALLPVGSVVNEGDIITVKDRVYPLHDISMFNCGMLITSIDEIDLLPTEIHCTHMGWQKDILLAIRPLIFYTVSGSSELFEMAKLSLTTVVKNASIDSINVLVSTEKDLPIVRSLFFCSDYRFDHIVLIEESAADNFTFARYSAVLQNASLFRNYSPIIYLDSDVLVDGPMTDLCTTARRTEEIMLFPEGLALDTRGWFGNNLMNLDQTVVISDQDFGYNSGIIIANNAKKMQELCSAVIELQRALLSHSPELLTFFDQPLINYIGRKSGIVNTSVLEKYARVGSLIDPNIMRPTCCLIHFLGGVGQFQRKLPKMIEHVESMGY